MLDMRTDETKLLNEIGDAIDHITDDAGTHIFFRWHNEMMTNKECIEKLLPLCKLLNKLFFDYGPPCTEDLEKVD